MTDSKPSTLHEEVRAILAETFNEPLEQIGYDVEFGDLQGWDSLGHMNMLAGLEEAFGVEVDADAIAELTSFQAIVAYLEAHRPVAGQEN